jgi:hypothetical protein
MNVPKLHAVREYEVDMPVPGTEEWDMLARYLREISALGNVEATLENVAIALTYQADVGNERFPPTGARKVAGAVLRDEDVYDPMIYQMVLEVLK